MAGVVRLAAVNEGSVDCEHGRASFVLKFATGQTITCISNLSEVEEIAAVLGRVAQQIRRTSPQEAVAKQVLAYGVTCSQPAGPILMRLVTPGGVSHSFALAEDWARDLASRLTAELSARSESRPSR